MQLAAGDVDAGSGITAGGLDRIKMDQGILTRLKSGEGSRIEGDLGGLEVAGDARIVKRTGPETMDKIEVSAENKGQCGDARLCVASQTQLAQNGVEFAEVGGVEFDGQR